MRRVFPSSNPPRAALPRRWSSAAALGERQARCASTSRPRSSPTSGDDTPRPADIRAARGRGHVAAAGDDSRAHTLQSFDWRTLVAVKHDRARDRDGVPHDRAPANFDTVQRECGRPYRRGRPDLDLADYGGSVPKLASRPPVAQRGRRSGATSRAALRGGGACAGLTILPWTVNEPRDMATLRRLQVDGIITDYPDRLRKVLAAKGVNPS